MTIKEIQKQIEVLGRIVEEAATTVEVSALMAEIAFWQRKLQEVLKSK